MQQMAALAHRPQIPQPIVGGITIEMGGGEHHAGQPHLSCLHEVWPSGLATSVLLASGGDVFYLKEPTRKANSKH